MLILSLLLILLSILLHKDASPISKSSFLENYEVVFVDFSGFLNICAHMTRAHYLEVCGCIIVIILLLTFRYYYITYDYYF
jgi:hypothetical protein